MYQTIDNTVTITKQDWLDSGLTDDQFWKDSRNGYLRIVKRGILGETLIDVRSIRRPDRLKAIEGLLGKLDNPAVNDIYAITIDTEAREYYTSYTTASGDKLEESAIDKYVDQASVFNAMRDGMRQQLLNRRAHNGSRIKKQVYWETMLGWYADKATRYNISQYGNTRSLERAFRRYCNDGYLALISRKHGNDAARVVSRSMENLFLALWRSNDKPFISHVHELYLDFVAGNKELHDKETGEIYRPDDFRHKGRALEVSPATIRRYLKDVVNNTAIYMDRNGNFDYANSRRPKNHRKLGKYSLSKVSMDDVVLSRKSTRGWVSKYIAVDVVSGYYFRPAYVVGKPTLETVLESFRNMFCELTALGLPIPGELEVEHHLMKDVDWLNEVFAFTRFCSSPTEKRAEHNIRSLKWGTAKKEGHTRGRWYANHEAYRSVRNKVSGDFIEPEYQPQALVADDLSDIEKHNNELHPLQKTYPGMTRREVFLRHINPDLRPIDKSYLYRYIGNEDACTIYNNDYVKCACSEFELLDFGALKRLKPNDLKVTAYWLPNEDGSVDKVYLYQGDRYIGEAINRSAFAYNECAVERTQEDEDKMLHQQKRAAVFDKRVRSRRAEIPKVGYMSTDRSEHLDTLVPEIVDIAETEQPKGYDGDSLTESIDWVARARRSTVFE